MKGSRFLIVNCASPYFFSIPMGTFGLADYLGRQGVEVRIFNPALYPEVEAEERLSAVLAEFAPGHVGLVCHWQETAHGLLAALRQVKKALPGAKTLAGGFTAAYFASDLLARLAELDYVIVGDPEEPVAHLLAGREKRGIANLVWREEGRVRINDRRWLIQGDQLDTISFADLSPLIDSGRYVEKVEGRLGFALFLGRGCVFDCSYCGGSRHAFARHSGRQRPAVRSLAAVLADLQRLRGRVKVLYLCYENDPQASKALFRAIASDPDLRGRFRLNYGAWHLLDHEFLALYKDAFACEDPPLFEFSPEVADDSLRREIKGSFTYTLADLEANIAATSRAFAGRVRIEVFFSRYHPRLSAAETEAEIGRILLCSHRLFRAGLPAHVLFDHLSTDVGSRLWEEHMAAPGDFSAFLRAKEAIDSGERHPFAVDNLCLLIPDQISEAALLRIEALCLVLGRLERHCHELVHLLTARAGDTWLPPLAELADELVAARGPAAFFEEVPLGEMVAGLGPRLAEAGVRCPPFLEDLLRFSRTKLESLETPVRPLSTAPDEDLPLRLDPRRVRVCEQDYTDLRPLLELLSRPDSETIGFQRTACLFLAGAIITLPHALFRTSLKAFEQPCTLAEYRAQIGSRDKTGPWHEPLLNRLLAEGLLVPAAGIKLQPGPADRS